MSNKKTCFVVMGFGKKVDFETGKEFDLDMTYKNVIKPAVEAADVECIRADEITHAGVIDVPMYERILEADLVVADISTGNRNAIYELGVRHALRPHTTIIIGEDSNTKISFDLNHIVIRKYRHLGEDIGASEARRVPKTSTSSICDQARTAWGAGGLSATRIASRGSSRSVREAISERPPVARWE